MAEKEGILALTVLGCLDWLNFDLASPNSVRLARTSYEQKLDVVERFVEECCIREQGASTPSKRLFEAFLAFRPGAEIGGKTRNGFGRRMTELGFERDRNSQETRYLGIALNLPRSEIP